MALSEHLERTPATSFPKPTNRAYYPALDGLRAVSFLGVFAHHYLGLPYGWAGVDVFFVLSGFLITGILFDTRDDPHRARNFYIRRTLRIFPLYYGVVFLVVVFAPFMHWQWSWYWIAWPLYLGNWIRFLSPHDLTPSIELAANAWLRTPKLPGNTIALGHFWSLCVEEQFYLIWPWIVFNVRSRHKLIYLCVACILAGPVARWYAYHHMPQALVVGEVILHSTPFRFDTLMVGALVALLYRGQYRERMQSIARVIVPMGLAYLAYVISEWLRHHPKPYDYPRGSATIGLALVSLFGAAVLLRCLVPGSAAYRLLNLRPLRAIGVVSYGAYVFHDIPKDFYKYLAERVGVGHDYLVAAAIGLPITLILAFISYRVFELPILRLKDRWTAQS